MNWSQPINQYCERTNPGLWAEPLNAVSNAAFLLAAAFAFSYWRRNGRGDLPALLLILLTFAIGIGSLFFHVFAVRWAWYADVVPIGIFIAGYVVLALVRFLGLKLIAAIFWLAVLETVVVSALALLPEILNRSAPYFPPLAALMMIGGLLSVRAGRGGNAARVSRERASARALFLAAVVFALSLTFRIVDLALCPIFAHGTHFLWHVFNGLVLYVLLCAAIAHAAQPQTR